MTILTCPIPGCGFATQDVDVVGAAAILTVHNNMHIAAPPPAPAPAPSRGPKLERPKLEWTHELFYVNIYCLLSFV